MKHELFNARCIRHSYRARRTLHALSQDPRKRRRPGTFASNKSLEPSYTLEHINRNSLFKEKTRAGTFKHSANPNFYKKKDNVDDCPSDSGSPRSPLYRKSQPPPSAHMLSVVGPLEKVRVNPSPPEEPSNSEKNSELNSARRQPAEQDQEGNKGSLDDQLKKHN